MSTAQLSFRDVSFSYGGEDVLSGIDLEFSEGEFVAISGPNGGGKSTLLRLALGLERPRKGEVLLFGVPPQRFRDRSRIGYLPQRAFTPADFPATVAEVVTAGLWSRRGWICGVGRGAKRTREDVDAAMEATGVASLAGRRIGELSGGQQQRVHLARAIVTRPELLILDEPTAGVDVEAQAQFRDLLAHLQNSMNLTVVLVSHEYGPLAGLVRRLVILAKTVEFDGPPPGHDMGRHWHHGLDARYLSILDETDAATSLSEQPTTENGGTAL